MTCQGFVKVEIAYQQQELLERESLGDPFRNLHGLHDSGSTEMLCLCELPSLKARPEL